MVELQDRLDDLGLGSRTTGEMDEEAVRKLANLGYVTARPAQPVDNENLADPKDRIETYDRLVSAYQQFQTGAVDDALQTMSALETVMSTSPQFYSEWGFFHSQAENWKAAADAYRRCLELAPEFKDARLNLAAAQIKSELYEAARENLELLIAVEPENSKARLFAGFCAQQLGDRDASVGHWREFVRLSPNHPDANKIKQALQSNQ